MINYNSEVQKLVAGFVDALSEVWRRQAVETLTGRPAGTAPSRRLTASATLLGRNRGRGDKRTHAEIDQLADSVVEFVAKNPGLRIEQINKELGASTKELALPIRKLVVEGVLKTKGKKRSTAYFPGESQRRRRSKN